MKILTLHRKTAVISLLILSFIFYGIKTEAKEEQQTISGSINKKTKGLESIPDESALKYYRVTSTGNEYESIVARMSTSIIAETTGYYFKDDCIVAYPEIKDSVGGQWIRIFAPYKKKDEWILLKYLTLSDDCHAVFDLAGSFFEATRKYLIETVIPYSNGDIKLSFNDVMEIPVPDSVTKWIKDYSSERYAWYSTIDEDNGTFCEKEMYCGPWYMEVNDETLKYRTFDFQELLFLYMKLKEFDPDEHIPEIIIKYLFIDVLHPGFIDGRIVFFHYPGAAHNEAWHFSKKNDKWILDTIYLITD